MEDIIEPRGIFLIGAHPERARRASRRVSESKHMGIECSKGFFYILTNTRQNVLYAGSTKNLIQRIKEHRNGHQKGFTQKYNVCQLVYYEIFEHIDMAKGREKKVKGWKRQRKIEMINSKNKEWKDLSDEIIRDPSLRSG